jgi:cyclic pyranopterin phosphate synthase
MNTLQDRFGRSIDYLRLSVTDRCDLRCSYCIPKGFKDFEEPENWLTFDEINRWWPPLPGWAPAGSG